MSYRQLKWASQQPWFVRETHDNGVIVNDTEIDPLGFEFETQKVCYDYDQLKSWAAEQ